MRGLVPRRRTSDATPPCGWSSCPRVLVGINIRRLILRLHETKAGVSCDVPGKHMAVPRIVPGQSGGVCAEKSPQPIHASTSSGSKPNAHRRAQVGSIPTMQASPESALCALSNDARRALPRSRGGECTRGPTASATRVLRHREMGLGPLLRCNLYVTLM